MKTVLLLCALSLVSCKPEKATSSSPTEADIREVATLALKGIISRDDWRRSVAADSDRLRGAKTPNERDLTAINLERTMERADAAEEADYGPLTQLHRMTAGKPPIWPAVEGFQSAVGMASDDERNKLRTLNLDQVIERFGVDAK